MSLTAVIYAAVGSWLILAVVCGSRLGSHLKRADAEQVNRITELPPVPESDAHWLDPWPSGSHLIDIDAVHGLLSEDEVYPTADEAESAVYRKLFDNLIEMSWPLERQDGAA